MTTTDSGSTANRNQPAATPEAEWLTIADAARRFGVTSYVIRNMIKQGDLPAWRIGPRLIRVKAADLDNPGTRI
jgi:excisionase family DNA binding protein